MIEAPERTGLFVEDFERFAAEGRPALLPQRRAAIERFAALGFPTTRLEEWKFTSVAPIAAATFRRPTPDGVALGEDDLGAETFAAEGWPRLVFVNGHSCRRLSAPAAGPARLESVAAILAREPRLIESRLAGVGGPQDAFPALNTAFMHDGAYVHVPRGAAPGQPIHILHVS